MRWLGIEKECGDFIIEIYEVLFAKCLPAGILFSPRQTFHSHLAIRRAEFSSPEGALGLGEGALAPLLLRLEAKHLHNYKGQ